MEVISDRTFIRESVHIDDTHFINCTLKGCRLHYSGGPVIFERTLITGCSHIMQGPAKATLMYLQELGLMEGAAKWVEAPEIIN